MAQTLDERCMMLGPRLATSIPAVNISVHNVESEVDGKYPIYRNTDPTGGWSQARTSREVAQAATGTEEL